MHQKLFASILITTPINILFLLLLYLSLTSSIKDISGISHFKPRRRGKSKKANAGWNAFKNTFGDSKHLLCKWHIKKALKGKFPFCGSASIQEEVYEVLEMIIDEKDEVKFNNLLGMFVSKYKTICPSYIDYFEEYYVKILFDVNWSGRVLGAAHYFKNYATF